jgi:hypothetical protein
VIRWLTSKQRNLKEVDDMSTTEKFIELIRYHDHEARAANEIRRKFETGDYVGGHAQDHAEWIKWMIATYSRLEAEHLALRDEFNKELKHLDAQKRASP